MALFQTILPAYPVPMRTARQCSRPAGEGLGFLEITLAMAFAGSSVVVGKFLSLRLPVLLSVELSLAAALAAILPLQLARLGELGRLRLPDLLSMGLQALFGIAAFRLLMLYGLRLTSAAHAGMITGSAPAVMACLAALLLRERLPGRALAAVVLTAAGLLLLNLPGRPAAGGRVAGGLAGDLLVLAAVVCEALLTIFRKSSGGRIGAVTNTTVLVAASFLLLLPLAALELRSFPLSRVDRGSWLAVGYYGAVATVIAYLLWGDGALRIPASRTGIATAAMPVSALALSALFLGERFTAPQLGGAAVVVAGILAAALPKRQRRAAPFPDGPGRLAAKPRWRPR
jgi:drug/metabolite transporter (DMT)-like permease